MEDIKSPKSEPMGIFISRGVSLRIKDLKIVLGPAAPEIPPITAEVLLSMSPFWLEIAITHLNAATAAHADVLRSHNAGNENEVGRALESEFTAGMQAIVAAATAMDALYASVLEHTTISLDQIEEWRDNRTARYKQVHEVLRRAFKIKKHGSSNLRQILNELYRFRDLAVHPSGKFSAPVKHPDIGVGTEWRFIAFGASNARLLVRAALAFTALLTTRSQGLRRFIHEAVSGGSKLD